MKSEQFIWKGEAGWQADFPGRPACSAHLVLVFGATARVRDGELLESIRGRFPGASILGCSTAGEIAGTRVLDDSAVATAIEFDHVHLAAAEISLDSCADSYDAGQRLARLLDHRDLTHALVISDGLKVNGTELVKGLTDVLPPQVSVTGGLAGDGALFQQTVVCTGAGAGEGKVAILGLYGDRLCIGCASVGGWDTFGPDRLVTRSRSNVLYELDGRSALELYKTYLGEYAAQLPASGLLFPLSIHGDSAETGVVRTILSVDESRQNMTFAGDIPEGARARLMRANFERLIDGAERAGRQALEAAGGAAPDLAILISCVGRKLVLKQRVEEEVEAVRDVFGPATVLSGFYSYGEICPFKPTAKCQLHNQTMTITTFSER